MDLKKFLYDNKIKFGIKDNISFGELAELESLIKNWNIDQTNINKDDINNLIQISISMTHLLEKCRLNKLPLKLSKEIDNLLEKIKEL